MHSPKMKRLMVALFIVSIVAVIISSLFVPMPRVNLCIESGCIHNGDIYWESGLDMAQSATSPMSKLNLLVMSLWWTFIDLIPMLFYHPLLAIVMFIVLAILVLAPIVTLILMCISLSKPKQKAT